MMKRIKKWLCWIFGHDPKRLLTELDGALYGFYVFECSDCGEKYVADDYGNGP